MGGRIVLSDADLEMCRDIEAQLLMHEEDMKRDFAARVSQIGQIMRAIYERGDEWFEENINLKKNSVELMQRGKIRERASGTRYSPTPRSSSTTA